MKNCNNKNKKAARLWWPTPLIQALGGRGRWISGFLSLMPAWSAERIEGEQNPIPKNQKRKEKKKEPQENF